MTKQWFDPNAFILDIGYLHLSVTWYSLSYIVGFFLAFLVMSALVKRNQLWRYHSPPVEADEISDLLSTLVLGVIIGGRLGYVIFYMPEYYIANPADILKVWNGGMSFHGGFLGVIISGYWFCWQKGIKVLMCADLIAVATPPGLFLGRVANFINGELWGRPTESPLGVVFPGEAASKCPVDIVTNCARHPSQLYEAFGEGLLLFAVLLLAIRYGSLQRPGTITGLFVAGYGLTRYLVEFVRVPDAQFVSIDNPFGFVINFGGYGFTMGQTLSLPMFFIGVLLVLRGMRYKQ